VTDQGSQDTWAFTYAIGGLKQNTPDGTTILSIADGAQWGTLNDEGQEIDLHCSWQGRQGVLPDR
jgi:hypothetical protein